MSIIIEILGNMPYEGKPLKGNYKGNAPQRSLPVINKRETGIIDK